MRSRGGHIPQLPGAGWTSAGGASPLALADHDVFASFSCRILASFLSASDAFCRLALCVEEAESFVLIGPAVRIELSGGRYLGIFGSVTVCCAGLTDYVSC